MLSIAGAVLLAYGRPLVPSCCLTIMSCEYEVHCCCHVLVQTYHMRMKSVVAVRLSQPVVCIWPILAVQKAPQQQQHKKTVHIC